MQEKYIKKGFTLIELLIVIAVIAGLATLFATSYPASQGRARDTHRRNDLKQYQTALETYANSHDNLYPASGIVRPSILCAGPLSTYSNCPDDPRTGTNNCNSGACLYNYESNVAGVGATQYTLWARLERPADDTEPFFVVCSNGQSGDGLASAGGGNCPL